MLMTINRNAYGVVDPTSITDPTQMTTKALLAPQATVSGDEYWNDEEPNSGRSEAHPLQGEGGPC